MGLKSAAIDEKIDSSARPCLGITTRERDPLRHTRLNRQIDLGIWARQKGKPHLVTCNGVVRVRPFSRA